MAYTHFPSLKKLVQVSYTDPRGQEGYNVHSEVEGPFIKDGECVQGTYVMYEDSNYPGNFIAVHVANEMNEETGEPIVNVVAMDRNRKLVRDRMAYRRRKCNAAVNEALNEGLNEFMNKTDRSQYVDGKKNPDVRDAVDDEFEDYPNDSEDDNSIQGESKWEFYDK